MSRIQLEEHPAAPVVANARGPPPVEDGIHRLRAVLSCSGGVNLLNDPAEESLANELLISSNFGQPIAFVDPRRAMLGVRVNLGGSPWEM